jgi:hypothetical protein
VISLYFLSNVPPVTISRILISIVGPSWISLGASYTVASGPS